MSDSPLCQYCGCPIEGKPCYCTACETPHHRDCFEDSGKCTTYACDCPSFYDAATDERVQLSVRRPMHSPLSPGGTRPNALFIEHSSSAGNPTFSVPWQRVMVLLFIAIVTMTRFELSSRRQDSRSPRPVRAHRRERTQPSRRVPRNGPDWSDIRVLKGTLCKAVLRRDVALAKRMIAYGAPVNGRWGSYYPLDTAAGMGAVEMCRVLVAAGARPRQERTREFLARHGIELTVNVERY